jgi:hypothetical protein
MPYGGGVADVLGVVDELGALGCVVTKVAGWYLEFCENLVKPLAISFYHVPSKFNMLGKHSRDIFRGVR